jgi:hypothetical protein
MKRLNNERGIALVTALLLTLISLTFVMAVLYMLTQGIKTTTSSKHYASALEATYGGVEFFTKDALPQMITLASTAISASTTLNSTSITSLYPTLNMAIDSAKITNACLQAKLTSTSANWGACTANNITSNISQLKNTADMTFTFPGSQGSDSYRVYAKIVDTPQVGNTDTSKYASGGLLIGGGVSRGGTSIGGGNTAATKIPFLYTIEIQGESANKPEETTKVTLLYAF